MSQPRKLPRSSRWGIGVLLLLSAVATAILAPWVESLLGSRKLAEPYYRAGIPVRFPVVDVGFLGGVEYSIRTSPEYLEFFHRTYQNRFGLGCGPLPRARTGHQTGEFLVGLRSLAVRMIRKKKVDPVRQLVGYRDELDFWDVAMESENVLSMRKGPDQVLLQGSLSEAQLLRGRTPPWYLLEGEPIRGPVTGEVRLDTVSVRSPTADSRLPCLVFRPSRQLRRSLLFRLSDPRARHGETRPRIAFRYGNRVFAAAVLTETSPASRSIRWLQATPEVTGDSGDWRVFVGSEGPIRLIPPTTDSPATHAGTLALLQDLMLGSLEDARPRLASTRTISLAYAKQDLRTLLSSLLAATLLAALALAFSGPRRLAPFLAFGISRLWLLALALYAQVHIERLTLVGACLEAGVTSLLIGALFRRGFPEALPLLASPRLHVWALVIYPFWGFLPQVAVPLLTPVFAGLACGVVAAGLLSAGREGR